jgi:hypothetical protein
MFFQFSLETYCCQFDIWSLQKKRANYFIRFRMNIQIPNEHEIHQAYQCGEADLRYVVHHRGPTNKYRTSPGNLKKSLQH